MRDLRKDDRLKLMSFNTWMTRTVDFTTDVAQVEKALRAVTAGGGTALFDALSVALTSATDPDRRQLVVFFTDGSDSSSTTSRELMPQIVDRTARHGLLRRPAEREQFSTGVASGRRHRPVQDPVEDADRPGDQRVATESGGSVMFAAGDLSLAFLRALDAFRSAYVLLYAPHGVERGGFHTIDVQVGRPDVVVLARRDIRARLLQTERQPRKASSIVSISPAVHRPIVRLMASRGTLTILSTITWTPLQPGSPTSRYCDRKSRASIAFGSIGQMVMLA